MPEITDEPGWQDRFQRGLQRALNTPHQPRTKPAQKATGRRGSNSRRKEGK